MDMNKMKEKCIPNLNNLRMKSMLTRVEDFIDSLTWKRSCIILAAYAILTTLLIFIII